MRSAERESVAPATPQGRHQIPGPYKDKSAGGLSSIVTPDKYTIVFHLATPYPDFNYVVAFSNTAPVPQAKDTGTNYQLKVQSTGPYMFQSYSLNKQLVLVRNPKWNPSWDTQAKQLPNKIVMDLNVNANDLDNRLLAGDIQVDAAGTGVQAAARAKVLSSNSLKASSDNPLAGFLWFIYLNTKVAPMNNLNCREAVEYAANKTQLQTAYGGPVAGGEIASTTLIPRPDRLPEVRPVRGHDQPAGDVTKAKAALQACGQPNGFTTGMAYRSDRPKEVQAAAGSAGGAGQVGIKLQLHGYPSGNYYSDFAGAPKYVHSHDLGIDIGGWAADWPNGNGMLDELVNGNSIVPAGNTNISELNDPVINNLFDQGELAAERQRPERALDPDRPPGHEGRGHPARGVRQVADLPEPGPDQRLRPAPVRHVQLRRARHDQQVVARTQRHEVMGARPPSGRAPMPLPSTG